MTDSSTTSASGPLPSEPPPVVPDYDVFPRSIGKGGYGRVFLARDVLGNWRAVKVVYRSRFESDTPYEREWEGIRRFEPVSRTHPSQASILHVHRDDAAECFWYVMELADDAVAPGSQPKREDQGPQEATGDGLVSQQDTRHGPLTPALSHPMGEGARRVGEGDGEVHPGVSAAWKAGAGAGEDTSGIGAPPEPSVAFDPARYTPRTLAHELKARGRLPFEECLHIGLALATALDHLHKHGLVHRDIKPGNIVFVNGIPKLADIGLVTGAGHGTFVGTEGYCPPEGPGTPTADVFGLGRVLYEMMTGLDRTEFSRLPPGFENWEGHDRWRALNEVVLRAATGKLDERYHSADELHRDLVVVQAGRSIHQQEVLRRHLKALRRVLVGLTLAAVVGGGVLYQRGLRQENERRLAQQRAKLSEESREQLQREVWLREAVNLRTGERWEGTSTDALAKLRSASQIRMGEDLRTEATAALAGLDTRRHHLFTNSAARHLAFDAQGRRLLFDSGGEGETRFWDRTTDQVASLHTTNCGPVWFAGDGSPRQFSHVGDGVFTISTFQISPQETRPGPLTPALSPAEGERVSEERVRGSFPVEGARRAGEGDSVVDPGGSPGGEWKALQEFSLPEFATAEDFGVQALAVSEDATRCAAAVSNSAGGRIAVWDAATGEHLGGLTNTCTALAISPDARCLATGDAEGNVHVWALPELNKVVSFQQSRDTVHCLAFRRDLSEPVESASENPWLLAAGDAGGAVWIYELGARRLMTICHGSAYDVFAVAFSPDGMTLASGGRYETRLWDVATGRFLVPVITSDHLMALAFSPDGRWLAFGAISVSDDRAETGLTEVTDGQGVHALRGLSAPSGKPTFSHDGRRLAALAHNWDVAIWNLESKRLERLFRAPKGILADNAALAFSPDDRQLAFATSRAACLWDRETGRQVTNWSLPPGLGQCLGFDALGRLVHFQWERTNLTGSRVCCVRDLFRTNGTEALFEFRPFMGRILDCELSNDGRIVVVRGVETDPARASSFLGGFDTLTGEPVPQLSSANTNLSLSELVGPMLDPTGRCVAFRNLHNLWSVVVDVSTGSPLKRDLPPLCALGPDGRWFVTPAGPYEQRLVLRRTDRPAWALPLGLDQRLVQPPAFSADARWLAWGTRDGAVILCDIEETQRRLKQHGLGLDAD